MRNKPKRGRKRTADSIKKRLDAIDEQLKTADPLTELRLVQERRDLTAELDGMRSNVDLKSIEDDVRQGRQVSYSERQGISYASWREVGVPASVLTPGRASRRAVLTAAHRASISSSAATTRSTWRSDRARSNASSSAAASSVTSGPVRAACGNRCRSSHACIALRCTIR